MNNATINDSLDIGRSWSSVLRIFQMLKVALQLQPAGGHSPTIIAIAQIPEAISFYRDISQGAVGLNVPR